MKKTILALLLAVAMIFVLSGCGSSDTGSQEELAGDSTESTTEAASDSASGDWIEPEELAEYYKFELDGKQYALPCGIKEFTDNGWFVEDDYLNTDLDANTKMVVSVYTDSNESSRAFTVQVANMAGGTQKLADCDVIDVEITPEDACNNSLTLTKAGVKVDVSSLDAIKQTSDALDAAYGPGQEFSGAEDYQAACKYWIFSERVDPEKRDGYVMGLSEQTSILDDRFELSFGGITQ